MKERQTDLDISDLLIENAHVVMNPGPWREMDLLSISEHAMP
jgi:hypothetical protein